LLNADVAKTQDPLSEFRQGQFACYLVSLGPLLDCRRKVEVQEKTIAELKSGMTALAATVKEQASQIQMVSAQLEASKPVPQVVNNP
jgi:uncharacterized coiled-coil protein SlyX